MLSTLFSEELCVQGCGSKWHEAIREAHEDWLCTAEEGIKLVAI